MNVYCALTSCWDEGDDCQFVVLAQDLLCFILGKDGACLSALSSLLVQKGLEAELVTGASLWKSIGRDRNV